MGLATGSVAGLGTWAAQRAWRPTGRIQTRAAANPKLAADAAALGLRPSQLVSQQLGVVVLGAAGTLLAWALAGALALLVVMTTGMAYAGLGHARASRARAARRDMASQAVTTAELMVLLLAGGASFDRSAREATQRLPEHLRAASRPWMHWVVLGEAAGCPTLAAFGRLCAQAAAGSRSREMLAGWARTESDARLAEDLTRAQGRSVVLVLPLVLVGASWLGILLYGLVSTLKA